MSLSYKSIIALTNLFLGVVLWPCFSQKGQQFRRIDSIKNAIKLYEQKNIKSDSTFVYGLLDISTAFASINKDSLFHYATLAKKESSKIQFHKATVLSYRNLGFYYSENGDNKRALENYGKALSLCDTHDLPNSKPDLLRLIGDEYYFLGDFENSLENLLNAVDIGSLNKKENLQMLSIANKNIARLFLTQKDYPTVLLFYDEVKALNKEMKSPGMEAITFANLAEIYLEMNRVETAKEYIGKSILYFTKTQRKSWLGHCYRVKGKILFHQENNINALEYLSKAEIIFKKLDDERESSKVSLDISEVLIEQKNFEQAGDYVQEAFLKSKRIGDIHLLQRSTELLYLLNKTSHPVQALQYLEQSKKLSDSIFNTNNFRGLNLYKAKLRYDQERKDLIISNEQKVKEKNLVILYVVVIVLILLGTLIPLYYKQKRLNKLNNELNQKTIILEEREKELNNANSSKDLVFSILGHDLKGPIVALHALLELYSENFQKTELNSYIPTLKSNVENILFTLTNLLNWGKTQLTGLSSKLELFDLNEIVNDNINFLSGIGDLKKISITNNIGRPVWVNADKNQISLVVRNLLSNAIKFTEVEGKDVIIQAKHDEEFWTISISDKGIGIPMNKQRIILNDDPIPPAKGTILEKGTGLGLMISKKMVLNNGGDIWFTSNIEHGTTFSFTLAKA